MQCIILGRLPLDLENKMNRCKEEPENKFSIEALQAMRLPTVPEELENILAASWQGRHGLPAESAMDALTDNRGNPMVCLSLVYKKYIHEEFHPFKDLEREFSLFKEIALELSND